MASTNKNVKVVLPPSGSAAAAINEDPKVHKQNLKNKITDLKTQEKNIKKDIILAQKELSRLSSGTNTTNKSKTSKKKSPTGKR